MQARAAEPAEPPTGADQIEGDDSAAEPLERAPAKRRVRMERVIERADEEDLEIGGSGGHETKVKDGLAITTRAQSSAASAGS